MGHVDASVIDIRSSEDNIFLADGVALLGIFPSIEPREVHHLARTVREVGYYSFFSGTHLEGLETENVPFHLYKGHVARQFTDGIEPTAIHMLIRIVLQQVAIRHDAQFLTEHLLARRPNAWQVLYVLLQDVVHPIRTSAIFKS